MADNGFIVLHRKLLKWEWYEDVPAFKVFLHCILKANFEDKKWRGIEIKRGSFITGRKKLAKETGLSEQQIRTALDKLSSTSELTIKTTNKNSLITVVNYGFYQDDDRKWSRKQPAVQPSSNHQVTTTNNYNNINNKQIYLREFENEFWPLAVKKVGKDAARKAYSKARERAALEEILPVWRAMNSHWKSLKDTEDWRYVPHPSTWLNEGRWQDEVQSNPEEIREKCFL